MGKRENDYQAGLIKRIEARFPGCLILKNDEQYIQGIPDLTVIWGLYCALLEVKRSALEVDAPQPNQYFYLNKVTELGGFGAYIYPEVEEGVLDALQRAFES